MSIRRELNEQEHTFCKIAFKNTQARFLSPKERDLLRSLESYFDWDAKLSDKQLSILKSLKHRSDHGIRHEAIKKGSLDPNHFKKLNREEYLQARYSPLGKATLHETRRR